MSTGRLGLADRGGEVIERGASGAWESIWRPVAKRHRESRLDVESERHAHLACF